MPISRGQAPRKAADSDRRRVSSQVRFGLKMAFADQLPQSSGLFAHLQESKRGPSHEAAAFRRGSLVDQSAPASVLGSVWNRYVSHSLYYTASSRVV